MTIDDALLYWISHRGTARRAQVRDAVQAAVRCLTPPEGVPGMRQERRVEPYLRHWWPLHELGHVERCGKGTWYVTPTTIVVTGPTDGAEHAGDRHATKGSGASLNGDGISTGRLYGSRDPSLLDALRLEASATGLRLDVAPQARGPSTWAVTGDSNDLRALAERLAVPVVEDPGTRLLASLPPLNALLATAAEGVVPAWASRVERYEPKAPAGPASPWVSHDPIAKGMPPGFYRVPGPGPTRWYWVSEDGSRQLSTRDERLAAEWRELRQFVRIELLHDPARRELRIPAVAPLPVLLERALITRPGRCAALDRLSRQRIYSEVDRARAEHVARVLSVGLVTSGSS